MYVCFQSCSQRNKVLCILLSQNLQFRTTIFKNKKTVNTLMYYVLFVSHIFIYVHWSTILRHYVFYLS